MDFNFLCAGQKLFKLCIKMKFTFQIHIPQHLSNLQIQRNKFSAVKFEQLFVHFFIHIWLCQFRLRFPFQIIYCNYLTLPALLLVYKLYLSATKRALMFCKVVSSIFFMFIILHAIYPNKVSSPLSPNSLVKNSNKSSSSIFSLFSQIINHLLTNFLNNFFTSCKFIDFFDDFLLVAFIAGFWNKQYENYHPIISIIKYKKWLNLESDGSFICFSCHNIVKIFGCYISIIIFICSSENPFNFIIIQILTQISDCIFQIIDIKFAISFRIKSRKDHISLWKSKIFIYFASGNANELSKIKDSIVFFLKMIENQLSKLTLMMESQIHKCFFYFSNLNFSTTTWIKNIKSGFELQYFIFSNSIFSIIQYIERFDLLRWRRRSHSFTFDLNSRLRYNFLLRLFHQIYLFIKIKISRTLQAFCKVVRNLQQVILLMTSASFYKGEQIYKPQGIYFQLPQDQLARELQRRKQQEVSRGLQADKIISENHQIKELRQKIQQAYLNKERAKQMADKQVRKVDQLINEAAFEAQIIKKMDQQRRRLQQQEACKAQKRIQGQQMLKRQMQEKRQKEKQAYDQYLRQKDEVQKVMKTLLQSQMKQLAMRETQKKNAFEDMRVQLQIKAQRRREEEELKKIQNQKYVAYMKELDNRGEVAKKVKEEKQKQKDLIFQKLKEQQEKRRRVAEQTQELRRQLYQEEYEAQMRRQQQEEQEKRLRQKYLMQQAEQQARERRRKQQQQEQKMEAQFRAQMLQRFAEQDKLQQMAQQKRRLKEQQHKREVERLWQEKLKAYKQAKQQEEIEYQKAKQDSDWQQELIRREKEKLLKEHLPNLEGFLPRDLVKMSSGFGQTTSNQMKQTGYSNNYKF